MARAYGFGIPTETVDATETARSITVKGMPPTSASYAGFEVFGERPIEKRVKQKPDPLWYKRFEKKRRK